MPPRTKRKPASKPKIKGKSVAISWKKIAAADKKVVAAKAAKLKVTRATFGQTVPGDISFDTLSGPVTLAELFGDKSDLIVIHNMGRACVYCTMWADGFTGLAGHLCDRAAFALSSPDSPQVQHEFATSRNWPFRMISVPSGGFAHAMGFEEQPGKFYPGVSAFHKNPKGKIVRTGAAFFGPGDDFCPTWPLLDLLKGGVGKWAPKYSYNTSQTCGSCCNCS